jgi:basic membrane protein A
MNPISTRAARCATVLLALAVISGACSSGTDASSSADDDRPRTTIVVITTAGPDDPFTESALSGAREVAPSMRAELEIVETTPERLAADVQDAVDAEPALIIGVGPLAVDAFDPAAAANLDQQFILVGGEAAEPTANLTAAVFRSHEALYLTGVEAGLMSSSGTVGAVAPPSNPLVDAWVGTFETGARSVDAEVVTAHTDDTGTGQALSRLERRGADVVQTVLPEVTPIGSTTAHPSFATGPNGCDSKAAVDSIVTHADLALEATVRAVVDGDPGGVHSFGLAEDAITFASLDGTDCLITRDDPALSRFRDARDAVAAGTIQVPDPNFAH